MTETEREEIVGALTELGAKLQKAFSENDVELYLSAFDPDAITSIPGTAPIRGHEALREFFKNRPGIPEGATVNIQPHEIEALSPEWAYAFGTDVIEHDGNQETMTFLVLLRRTQDGWKTFREVVSADQ